MVVVEEVVSISVFVVGIRPRFFESVLPSSFKYRLQNCPTFTVTILVSCDESVLILSFSPCWCGLTNGKEGGEGMGSKLLPDFRGRSDPSAMKAMAFR
jgi:hypothetical protein